MPRADAESLGRVEDREGDVHRVPVEQRLAHAHEHDVGGLVVGTAQDDLPHLTRDLERREVPPVAHPAGGAEGAAQGAPGLGADAERPAAAARNQYRFDGFAVRQPPEVLPGTVGGLLDDLGLETGQGMLPLQRLPELQRQLGGRSPTTLDRGNPQPPRDLLPPVAGQPTSRPGRQAVPRGAGSEIEEGIAGHR